MLVFFLTIFTCSAQENATPCDSAYLVVDQPPMFGTDEHDLYKYLSKHFSIKEGCEPPGKLILTWTINAEGKMIDIDVKGIDGHCKTEILDEFKSFPDWTPGKHKGKPVCVKMLFPLYVHFR